MDARLLADLVSDSNLRQRAPTCCCFLPRCGLFASCVSASCVGPPASSLGYQRFPQRLQTGGAIEGLWIERRVDKPVAALHRSALIAVREGIKPAIGEGRDESERRRKELWRLRREREGARGSEREREGARRSEREREGARGSEHVVNGGTREKSGGRWSGVRDRASGRGGRGGGGRRKGEGCLQQIDDECQEGEADGKDDEMARLEPALVGWGNVQRRHLGLALVGSRCLRDWQQ